jgi:hypothetical protein
MDIAAEQVSRARKRKTTFFQEEKAPKKLCLDDEEARHEQVEVEPGNLLQANEAGPVDVNDGKLAQVFEPEV